MPVYIYSENVYNYMYLIEYFKEGCSLKIRNLTKFVTY
jgi:hypothetical protein